MLTRRFLKSFDLTLVVNACTKYAIEARELTDWKNWQYLDTLAAAYAETGEFESAIKW